MHWKLMWMLCLQGNVDTVYAPHDVSITYQPTSKWSYRYRYPWSRISYVHVLAHTWRYDLQITFCYLIWHPMYRHLINWIFWGMFHTGFYVFWIVVSSFLQSWLIDSFLAIDLIQVLICQEHPINTILRLLLLLRCLIPHFVMITSSWQLFYTIYSYNFILFLFLN